MSDEGVHEIQLNGKQLVFMFMAVTVVAVVIFLCGVMVGRGVRAPHTLEASEQTTETTVDPTAAIQPAVAADATSASTGSAAPLSTQEKLTYADRLAAPTAPPETLREPVVQNLATSDRTPATAPAPAPAIKTPPPPAKPAPAKVEAPPAKIASNTAKPEPKPEPKAEPKAASEGKDAGGNGFAVQVAAVKARSEADTIAKRLSSKGFPSYVTTPGPGAAHVYRVRVGKYTDRREAESVARRLEKEEQFKPWITR
jgi:cell division septation protein DedD